MAAALGTIPALPTYNPGGLAIGSTIFIEIVDSLNATTAISWNIAQQDFVGKAPSVMNYNVPVASDQIAYFQHATGLPMQCNVGDLSIPSGNLPAAGGTGTILSKVSATSYAANWTNISNLIAGTSGLVNFGTATSVTLGIATTSILSSMIASGAINTLQIANNAIGSAQLATGAVVATSITANAITSAQLANNSIGTNQLASSLGIASSLSIGTLVTVGGTATITGTTILNGGLQVSGTSILTGTFGVVGTSLLTGVFGVVGTTLHTGIFTVVGTSAFTGSFNFSVLGTSTFTGAHFVNGTALFTSGNFGVVGTTLFTSSLFSVVGTSQFTSNFFGVNGTATFTTNAFGVIGTTLHTGTFILGSQATGILVSSGTGVVSAQGGMVLLNTLSPNNVASTNDTTSLTGAYRNYMIEFDNVCPATQTTTLQLQIATSGSNFVSGGYVSVFSFASPTGAIVDTSTTVLLLSGTRSTTQLQTTSTLGLAGSLILFNAAGTVPNKQIVGTVGYMTPGGTGTANLVGGTLNGYFTGATNAITGLNFSFSSGNIQTGTIKIYGMT